jgi:hypothetical protein
MKQTQSRRTEMSETGRNNASRKLAWSDAGASSITVRREHSSEEGMNALEQVVARENMMHAPMHRCCGTKAQQVSMS